MGVGILTRKCFSVSSKCFCRTFKELPEGSPRNLESDLRLARSRASDPYMGMTVERCDVGVMQAWQWSGVMGR